MNRKIKKAFFVAACVATVCICGSTGVCASMDADYGFPAGTHFFIMSIPIIIVALICIIAYKLYKSGYDIFRTGENDKFNTLFRENHPEGLNVNEQIMLDKLKSDLKSKKPDPVNILCPNCGAPLSLSDKVTCPYCHTEITNRSAVKRQAKLQDVVMSEDEDFNPMRYYEENITGYKKLDEDMPRSQMNRNSGSSMKYHSGSGYADSNSRFDDSFDDRNMQ